ncbi:hypothetical protein SAMN05443247_11503 [Bradyrhizobium erythrophlei]|nr:hypothetical protein SAMN05443247_11503 [Bradyrhizobium erythrophlei]
MNDIVEGKAYRKSQPKALRILRAHREDLEKIGVRHADIFGRSRVGRNAPIAMSISWLISIPRSFATYLLTAGSSGPFRIWLVFRWTSHGVVGFATR